MVSSKLLKRHQRAKFDPVCVIVRLPLLQLWSADLPLPFSWW